MNPQVEMEWCAVWRALDGASERLLRASEDMALSELRGLRTELEELARQALQTSAAQPARTSAATGKTSATTENPIAATGISIAATGKPGAARGNVTSSSSVRALALAKASVCRAGNTDVPARQPQGPCPGVPPCRDVRRPLAPCGRQTPASPPHGRPDA